jgi:Protein of unknown function (DUF3592)
MSPSYTTDAILAGIGVFAFILGVVFYFVHGWQKLKIHASKTWPSVVGTIISSALERSNPKRSTAYCAAVRYSYRVGGKDYVSNRVFWGPNEGREQKMAEIVAEYPLGKDVWVQHDPKDPANAVLRPDIVSGLNVLFYYAGGMMALGIVAFGAGLYALSH